MAVFDFTPTPTQEKIRNPKSEIAKGPADVLDRATSEIAMGSKLGIDATKKLPGEGFKRPWPPLIRMSDEVRRKINALFGSKHRPIEPACVRAEKPLHARD